MMKNILSTSFLLILAILISCEKKDAKINEEIGTADLQQKWKFVAFGDCRGTSEGSGVNVEILDKLVKQIVQDSPDFVLFTGDICYGHARRKELGDSLALVKLQQEMMTFRNTIEPLYQNDIVVYLVRGNHETTQYLPDSAGTPAHRPIWPETKKVWDQVFSGKYAMPQNGPANEKNVTFSVEHKNVLIVGLDLYTAADGTVANLDGSIPKPATKRVNQVWLDSILAKNTSSHIFSFTHEPAFKVDHKDCMHGDMSYGLDYSAHRDQFWKSMAKAGSRVYFCGHDHGFAHARIDDGDGDESNDMHQVVVGTAGAGKNISPEYDGYNGGYTPQPVSTSKDFGYSVVEIAGDTATVSYKYLEEGSFSERDVLKYTAN
ncbi:metallophosphoesterase [Flammeovirgaceae bacterium SG7u.111]|nr:metallophosphoesterase [Flammeovirgaceae bacterium SG7u.132]WPO34447.1 metallophosphoesterase [Flammeovirgaceae bacterium SG7u.111]